MALSFFFTGGGASTSVLGGLISSTAVTETEGVVFPNVTTAEAISGIIHYACICIKNTGGSTINNPGVYFFSTVTAQNVHIAKGLTGKNSTTEQVIANNTTAPTGSLVYTKPAFSYSPLLLGVSLAPGEFFHLWIRRTVAANAPGSNNDYVILTGNEG